MSAEPGKVQVLGIQKLNGQKYFVLRFLQAKDVDKVARPFFAKYDPNAIWWTDLQILEAPNTN